MNYKIDYKLNTDEMNEADILSRNTRPMSPGFIAQVRKWTLSAIECYHRKGMCSDCPMLEIMETPCNMDFTVSVLLKKLGKPNKQLLEKLEREVLNDNDNASTVSSYF